LGKASEPETAIAGDSDNNSEGKPKLLMFEKLENLLQDFYDIHPRAPKRYSTRG